VCQCKKERKERKNATKVWIDTKKKGGGNLVK